jgi:predicted DNA-binding transcriptional regulator YafY
MRGIPFDAAGAGALGKIMSAMSDESAGAARDLADRVRLMEAVDEPPPAAYAALVQQAVLRRRVIEMSYADRFGEVTARAVEPLLLMCGTEGWYLVGWCRLRQDNRLFRLDRITAAQLAEPAPVSRTLGAIDDLPPDRMLCPVTL